MYNAACEEATSRFTYWLLSEAGSRGLQQGSPQEIAANPMLTGRDFVIYAIDVSLLSFPTHRLQIIPET